jgi:hypothetical protein
MFSNEFLSLFKQVAGSWQVIAVTISIILYVSLVTYVGRAYRRSRKVSSSKSKPKKKKAESKAPVVSGDDLGDTTNEELGLE